MARRVTPAQLKSMLRQEQLRQQRAINDYNRKARQHNTKVKRAVDDYNREVDRYNGAQRKQQREIEAHNRRVRQNQQRLGNEMRRLERQASNQRYVPVQASVRVLTDAYEQVDVASETWIGSGAALADLAEAEAANSAAAANALLGDPAETADETTVIDDELSRVSRDLDQRWRGAIFALDPRNPDAARHFCTSAREILTRMIDLEAPDEAVLAQAPGCQKLRNGRPVRRAKIAYLLGRAGADHHSLRTFVDSDIDDVLQLIGVFSEATHGEAGVFDLQALRALKLRVEGAIRFLSAIVQPQSD